MVGTGFFTVGGGDFMDKQGEDARIIHLVMLLKALV